MNKNIPIIVEEGYTVIYQKKDGSYGHIATDTQSGGYPYFSDNTDYRNVYQDPARAEKDLQMMLMDMRKSFNNGNINFDSAKVVKMLRVFEDVDNEDIQNAIFETAKAKLSESELEIIKQKLLEEQN